MEGTEIVVESYYPEWSRTTLYYRVTRIKHGTSLVLEDTFSGPEEAWDWYDANAFNKG